MTVRLLLPDRDIVDDPLELAGCLSLGNLGLDNLLDEEDRPDDCFMRWLGSDGDLIDGLDLELGRLGVLIPIEDSC